MRLYPFAIALVCAVACGVSPDDARRELTAIGVAYTSESFIDSVMADDRRAIELFLVAGIDLNSTLRTGQADEGTVRSALSAAIHTGNLGVARTLIEHGAEVNGLYSEVVAQHEYEERGQSDFLYGAGHERYTPLTKALWWATRRGEFGDRAGSSEDRTLFARMLVEAGADVNGALTETYYSTPPRLLERQRLVVANTPAIDLALHAGDGSLLRALIEAGADVNGTGSTAGGFSRASLDDDVAGWSLLYSAACYDHIPPRLLEILLDAGAGVGANDPEGPLECAQARANEWSEQDGESERVHRYEAKINLLIAAGVDR